MAANPQDIQDVARRRFPPLGTLRQVRKFTASIIRKMDRDEIELDKGKSLVWAAMQLHGMIRNEQSPGAGNTTNVLVVAGEISPSARLAQELWGPGERQAITGLVQERPVVAVGSGDEATGLHPPVAVPAVSGDSGES